MVRNQGFGIEPSKQLCGELKKENIKISVNNRRYKKYPFEVI